MRTITLEEHYASQAYLDGPGRKLKERAQARGSPLAKVVDQLCDLGDKRIAEMDAAGIDVQVLSLTSPGAEQLDSTAGMALACEANDHLADAVRKYPSRLAGFATLPTANPEAAAAELERTVRDYGFKGAVINGHIRGRYLDDKFFWPILERAEALNVPIYLHPALPPQPVIDASYAGFDPIVTDMLAGPGWGWHIETAIHVIRVILGGTFDRFPKLQVIIGHMGEFIPYCLTRSDLVLSRAATHLQRRVSDYFRTNFHLTTSGYFTIPPLLCALMVFGPERMIFAVDYPYSPNSAGRALLSSAPISPSALEMIAHGNAEKLLKLPSSGAPAA